MTGVVYEVTLRFGSGIAAAYDAWLREHVAEMLALPGFQSAEIFAGDGDGALPDGTLERVVCYRLRERAALDAYFREHAGRMRAAGIERFGSAVEASRRILSPLD